MATKQRKRYSVAIERNLMAVYYRANSDDMYQGMDWYQRAHDIGVSIGRNHGCSTEQALGVIAALSPGLNWTLNVEQAELFVSEWMFGKRGRQLSTVGTYGRRNVVKCTRILKGESPLDVLGGNKVRSFYRNMLSPSSKLNVTVDRHAKCACYGVKNSDNSLVKNSEYDYLAEHFIRAAGKLNIVPCSFQAVVWVTWRRLNGNIAQFDLNLGLEEIPF